MEYQNVLLESLFPSIEFLNMAVVYDFQLMLAQTPNHIV
jgi:hypothetical protein